MIIKSIDLIRRRSPYYLLDTLLFGLKRSKQRIENKLKETKRKLRFNRNVILQNLTPKKTFIFYF